MAKTRTVTVTITDESNDDPIETLQYALQQQTSSVFSYVLNDLGTLESSYPELNVAKLLELQGWVYGEHLKAEAGLPSEWNQSEWLKATNCGTACCIAGKTVLSTHNVESFDDWMGRSVVIDGEKRDTPNLAQEILGLTSEERGVLFAGDNDYDDISRAIAEIVDGEYRK